VKSISSIRKMSQNFAFFLSFECVSNDKQITITAMNKSFISLTILSRFIININKMNN